MTQPFYPGDKVKRLNDRHGSLVVGEVGTVLACTPRTGGVWSVTIEEDRDAYPEHSHSSCNLALVSRVAATPTARKDDSGKLDMTLLDDMPRALAAVAEVMQWAITKKQPAPYVRGSWLGVHADRYRAAVLRHNNGQGKQATADEAPRFTRDAETSLLHQAHIACSALMALENTLRELETKKD